MLVEQLEDRRLLAATLIATIPVGSTPVGLAENPVIGRTYVANNGSGTVSVIDDATNNVIATIDLGAGSMPSAVGVDTSTNRVYVVESNTPGVNEAVAVIDGTPGSGAENTVVATIPVPGRYLGLARNIAVNPTTHYAYIPSFDPGGRVVVIDGNSNTLLTQIAVSANPLTAAYDSLHNRVYVGHGSFFLRSQLTIIDAATNGVSNGPTVGIGQYDLGANPTTHSLYVHKGDPSRGSPYGVVVVDTNTNTVSSTIAGGSNAFGGVGVDSTVNRIYVADATLDNVRIINGAPGGPTTDTVVGTVTVGDQPAAVAVNAALHRIFVANTFGNSVSVIADIPDTVYVDDDWVGLPVGTDPDGAGPATAIGFDAFDTIQGGVNGVDVSGTVNVLAGTYAENILIEKEVKLHGAQVGVDANGRLGDESIITASSEFGLEIRADNVTVDGFEFTGYKREAINVRPTNSAPGVSTRDNIVIRNNHIHLAAGPLNQVNGIVFGEKVGGGPDSSDNATISNVTIAQNLIDVDDDSSARGIVMTGQFATILFDGFDISDNTIKAKNNGLFISENPALYTANGIEVLNNHFEKPGSLGINMGNLDSTSKINGNTFINNASGAAVNFRQAGGEVLNNSFTNHTNVGLFFFDATFFPQSSEDATVTGNSFTNNFRQVGAPALAVDLDAILNNNAFDGGVRVSSNRNLYGGIQEAIDNAIPGDNVTVVIDTTYSENVDVNQALTLQGEATIDGTLTASVSGATIGAGFSPGVMTSNSLILTTGSVLNAEIDGSAGPGAVGGHDQYVVNGPVSLGGATLSTTGSDIVAASLGDTFVIVDNNDTDAVIGTFAGLANGAVVTVGSLPFRIFYDGGTGNDVVLVRAGSDPSGCVDPTYVDDDWAGTIPGIDPDGGGPATAFGIDAFATIQEGVDHVCSGGTVIVNAGTYNENVTVGKAVTIDGAGQGSTIVDQPGNIFTVTSSDVTFQDMTIRNGSQAIRIDLFSSGGTADNIEVNNVEFRNNSSRGIEIHNNTTVTDLRVLNSLFDGNGTGIRWASSAVGVGVLVDNSTFRNHTSELGIYQANDGSTGYVRDLTVTNSTFENNSFAAIYGEELREVEIADNMFEGNGRGFYLFKAYSSAGVLAGDISIHDNEFTDHTAAAVEIWAGPLAAGDPGAQLDLPVSIQDNTIHEDVSVLSVNWGQIDIRLKATDEELTPSPLTHAAVTVDGNTVNLTGSFTGGATAAHAIKLRGDVDGVTVRGNTLDGGSVGGAGSISEPPTSGIYVVADDSFWGSMSAGSEAVIDGNGITGFVNGITSFDPAGGLIGPNLTITDNVITNNDAVGVVAHAGNTLLAGNDLNDNGDAGLLAENGAIVDAGQTSPGTNFTGLGISGGGNSFLNYTPVGTALAIRNDNMNPPNNLAGAQGLPYDLTAEGNLFSSNNPAVIELLVDHDADASQQGLVNFSNPLHLTFIVDNRDPSPQFVQSGFTNYGIATFDQPQGYLGNIHYLRGSSPAGIATWTFSGLPVGYYRVSATWFAHNNRATDSPFRVYNGTENDPLAAISRFNQQLAPNDLQDQNVGWEDITRGVLVTDGTLTVTLDNVISDPSKYVIADGMRIELINFEPQIEVRDAIDNIVETSVDFGTTLEGGVAERTITIKNTSLAQLDLGVVSVTGTGFSVTPTADNTVLAPGASTTFKVILDTAKAGSYSGTVSIPTVAPNHDPDETTVTFNVTGVIIDTLIIDNRDPSPQFVQSGFTNYGIATFDQPQGYLGNIHYLRGSSPAGIATWTFSGLPVGYYRVSATWFAHNNRATDSPFRVYNGLDDGGPEDAISRFNQQLAPNDLQDQNVGWEDITRGVYVTTGTLTVTLDNVIGDPTKYVIADGIRIERIDAEPQIEVRDAVDNIVETSIDLGTTLAGGVAERMITIKNTSSVQLDLGVVSATGTGFSVTTSADNAVLAPGASTTFKVVLDTAKADSYSGTVSIPTAAPNHDPDETTVMFNVTGVVYNTLIIDNRDPVTLFSAPGFTNYGTATFQQPQGYLGNIHYLRGSAPAGTATWTFTGLPDGFYQASATWFPQGNRAIDSPFKVYVGGPNPADQEDLNQQQPPNDFFANAVGWEDIGDGVQVTGGTLTVTLDNTIDDTSKYVIADAVRIERLCALVADAAVVAGTPDVVSEAAVSQALAAATTGWVQEDASAAAPLAGVSVQVAHLPGAVLGLASESTGRIWIDSNAAGHGWNVSQESRVKGQEPDSTIPYTLTPSPAHPITPSSFDLLTVVSHELGHVLGLPDLDADLHPHDVMAGRLDVGVRRLPMGAESTIIDFASPRGGSFDADRIFTDLGGSLANDALGQFRTFNNPLQEEWLAALPSDRTEDALALPTGRLLDDEDSLAADLADHRADRREAESVDQLFADLLDELSLSVEN